mgnify:CR=1 FL=1
MTKAVVDDFEAIQIEKQHSHTLVVALGLIHGMLQP